MAAYRREWKAAKRRKEGVPPRAKPGCKHGHAPNLDAKGRCRTCRGEDRSGTRVRVGRHGPLVLLANGALRHAWRCARGHDLRIEGNVRATRTECAVCHRFRKLDGEGGRYVRVLQRDPCSYCGGPCEQIDHIVPVASGGANAWENLTAACRSCNAQKRTIPLLAFMLRVR